MYMLEVIIWIVGVVLISCGPWMVQVMPCSQQAMDAILGGQRVYIVFYGIFLLFSAVLFVAFMDPLGCCGTSIFSKEHRNLKLSQNVKKDILGMKTESVEEPQARSTSVPNHSNPQHPGLTFWLKVVSSLLCCFRSRNGGSTNNHRSIDEQIALALAVLFENQDDLVLTDVWAAFILVRNHHKQKVSQVGESETQTCVENELVAMMRRVSMLCMWMYEVKLLAILYACISCPMIVQHYKNQYYRAGINVCVLYKYFAIAAVLSVTTVSCVLNLLINEQCKLCSAHVHSKMCIMFLV